ncbi:hypothetical protein D3250_00290 [Nesterenkonia natronophila]|uniref:Uncharacterized protein n=2 Tax=Nesterenkonia natronophila TaxID=2174932 RepID=A0A3A4F2R3_9MICC|nr:hypothetical protein D3250_00290 [Nesterenkonia natronophila]
MPQTLAGMLTAVSVTYFMSFLGVAGTVIGVALVSVLTVLGNFMYSSAIYSAKEKVKRAQPKVRNQAQRSESLDGSVSNYAYQSAARFETATDAPESFSSGPGGPETTEPEQEEPSTVYPETPEQSSPGRIRQAWRAMMERYGPKKIFGSIALVFVLLAGTVTVIEMSVGQPLSDIVRNEDSSGTTFFGGGGGSGGEGDEPDVEDDSGDELPPPEQEDVVEDPAAPEAPPQEEQGPVEQPQQEEQPAPEEDAPEQ